MQLGKVHGCRGGPDLLVHQRIPTDLHGNYLARNYYAVSDGFSRAWSRTKPAVCRLTAGLKRFEPGSTSHGIATYQSALPLVGRRPWARSQRQDSTGLRADVLSHDTTTSDGTSTGQRERERESRQLGKAPKEGRHGLVVVTCILQLSALSTSTALRRSSISCIMCYETETT
ncbi:hypothetical protein GW17_00027687 [Ensete ventricosum]|nr:hypothetical protein GW17_00027687 [Ensete ventricosum]